jgi:RNA recognition motif-containing protein
MNIQVSNMNLNLIESDLQRLFSPYGEVGSIDIIRDKLNNRSRGRAMIKMPVSVQAKQAIISLHGKLFAGKRLNVEEAPNDKDEDVTSAKLLL